MSQYSGAQPSARRPPAARGGSVITEPRGARRPPARKHAAGPGTGKSGGEPQRPQPRHAPALEPPQAARLPPRLSQGPAVSSPPRTSHSESIAFPALGTAPASGPWGFRHHGTSRRQTPTSAQARRRAGNGEERGRTPAPATPPRSRSRAPTSRTASPPASVRGPRSRRPPEHPTAKALRAQPSARRPPAARGGSVITEPRGPRRPPARKHAAGPGTGKSGGEPQRPQPRHAPALEPPASRGAYACLSQGPAVSSPPRTSHSESIAGPALGTAPASGPWGFRHHGTSRRQTPTSAQARRRAGNGEERGRTPAPATPPRSRSRAPSKPRGVRPPQSGAHGLL